MEAFIATDPHCQKYQLLNFKTSPMLHLLNKIDTNFEYLCVYYMLEVLSSTVLGVDMASVIGLTCWIVDRIHLSY